MSERDPYYLGEETWKYGAIREVRLQAIVSTEVLWAYEYTRDDEHGSISGCGGFTGPFEALAHALQRLEQAAQKGKRVFPESLEKERIRILEHALKSYMDFMLNPTIAGDEYTAISGYANRLHARTRKLLGDDDE